jgi:hypothetical protein
MGHAPSTPRVTRTGAPMRNSYAQGAQHHTDARLCGVHAALIKGARGEIDTARTACLTARRRQKELRRGRLAGQAV